MSLLPCKRKPRQNEYKSSIYIKASNCWHHLHIRTKCPENKPNVEYSQQLNPQIQTILPIKLEQNDY